MFSKHVPQDFGGILTLREISESSVFNESQITRTLFLLAVDYQLRGEIISRFSADRPRSIRRDRSTDLSAAEEEFGKYLSRALTATRRV